MGIISGFIRRLLGGFSAKIKLFRERGVQILLLILIYAPIIYFSHYYTYLEGMMQKWLFILLTTTFVIISELKGHFPGFMCGTEDQAYIDEQLAKGRKIPYRRIVTWWGKNRGYEEFDKEWCFWQLILCKTMWTLPVVCFVGSQFWFAGLCTAFAYNAMFWVDMKPFKKILVSPTNWGEFWQGCLYMWALWRI